MAAVASLGFVAALVQGDCWLAFFTSHYRNHGGLAIADFLGLTERAEGGVRRVFWNPSTLGAIGLLMPVVLTTTVLLASQQILAKQWVLRPLLVLGRHALLVFLLHYGLLGCADLVGLHPSHGGWTVVMTIGLVMVCWGVGEMVDWWKGQRAALGVPA